jgi:hypothetical protein
MKLRWPNRFDIAAIAFYSIAVGILRFRGISWLVAFGCLVLVAVGGALAQEGNGLKP